MSARDFKLPDLGEGLTEAEIVQWLVKEGDTIELNQPIVEVETEKALVEIPSPFAGTVEKIFGEVGAKVAVGSTIITVETTDDAPKTGRKEVLVGYGPEEGGSKRRKNRKIGRREDEAPDQPEQPARALATPPVRKLARDLGVDIDAVNGSGKEGRVTREDVLAAADSTTKEPAAEEAAEVISIAPPAQIRAVPDQTEERIPVRAIRRSIAEKMVRSAFTIPHVAEWLQVDASELMKLRTDLQASPEAKEMKISPLPIIVKALLAALRKHPLVNSSWDDETNEIVVRHVYHIGIATDTERGLLVPVVKNADHLNIFELSRE
ncbi:MAG: 2-oxo acid dehydrogenase subunit E2, partial [Actinobacteria bacterium]